MQLLVSTGLIKIGHSSNSSAIVVVKAEWDKFIHEERLQDLMEVPNRTQVGNDRYFFINLGDKKLLSHRPGEQFNGKFLEKGLTYISTRQRKLHKVLSEILIPLRHKAVNYMKEVEEAVKDVSDDEVEDAIPEPTPSLPVFVEEHKEINQHDFPMLFEMFQGKESVPARYVNALFCELLNLLKKKDSASVDITYGNGKCGRVVIVPKVKTQASFMEKARKLKWVDSILEHMVSEGSEGTDSEDAAEWICYYIGKKFNSSFTIASEALGYPLVQRMDEAATEAMWADANVNVTQQRIIKRHMRYYFGKRIFLAEKGIAGDYSVYSVPTFYGEYKYYKDGDRSQKPEKCMYWSRNAAVVVKTELERLLDYSNLDVDPNKLSSLANTIGCTLVVGADQGQGAWRSWIKISTMSGAEIRSKMASDPNFQPKDSYILSQVAHIVCKKDHHEILSATVSEDLSAAYEILQVSSLVFVKEEGEERVKSYFIPKNARNVSIEHDKLTYSVDADETGGFSMKHSHDDKLKEGSLITLIIPHFNLYVTGDLSFYADVLGMPKSSSYWCPWCLLSRIEWQQSAESCGEKRTIQFLTETYDKVKQDTQKRMQPTEKKGVATAMHYKALGPDHFIPPLLHMEMGLVNQVWEDFEGWVDDVVEQIPLDEKAAREAVVEAKDKLAEATNSKESAKNTITVEIRQTNAEIKRLKREFVRRDITNELKQEIDARLTLLTAIVKENQAIEKNIQQAFKHAQETLKQRKKQLEDMKTARGKPHSSIASDVELTLGKFLICRASYHGGDFNGVCCRRLVQHATDIILGIKPILVSKKDNSCDEREIEEKLETVENTLGLVDAAFAYLNMLYPTEDEKQQARQAVNTLMSYWRNKTGLTVSLKGHVMEKHACDFNDSCGGLGDKEESFVEQGHQVGMKDDRRYMRLTNFVKRSDSTMRSRAVSSHPLVKERQEKVAASTKRKRASGENEGAKTRMKNEAVKKEKEQKREHYVRINSQN